MGTSREKILQSFDEIIAGNWKTGNIPKFWDGHAAQRITELICNI
jgi:UDP-N-acetylglucosamine 2-epimerase (non-hydrolysing)